MHQRQYYGAASYPLRRMVWADVGSRPVGNKEAVAKDAESKSIIAAIRQYCYAAAYRRIRKADVIGGRVNIDATLHNTVTCSLTGTRHTVDRHRRDKFVIPDNSGQDCNPQKLFGLPNHSQTQRVDCGEPPNFTDEDDLLSQMHDDEAQIDVFGHGAGL